MRILKVDSSIHNKRIKASDLARRSSDDFCETYGHSPLESIAPFQRGEIILGRRVGAGSFSSVYDIQDYNLSAKQSDKYTDEHEQAKKREATAKSVMHGTKYVMKCLKDKLEESDADEYLFHCAAQDIAFEAEMLAALSHPNIIKLHGVVDSHHDAFLDGASEFFIILERLDCTLTDKIEGWAKNSFNPSRSFKSLRSSLSSRALALDKAETEKGAPTTTSVDEGRSLVCRLRVAASLADAMEYLHAQNIVYRDLKPDNVGFDRHGNLKLFDFGLARFMPRHGDACEDVFEMTGLGTPRYTSPEVLFHQPYNLKADVYSFCVVLWEIMSLKKPFAKYNQRKDLKRAFSRLDSKPLSINRRWPQPIQDIFRSGLSRDLWARPVMSDMCKVLTECTSTARDLQKFRSSFSSASTSSIQEQKQKHYRRRRQTTVDTISSDDS
uniref:Protein kinase domain-containing protein n=1 Tax=Skeletonema marinoi TaxID=267567 RepID=A0A7S2Q514_9STRA